MNYKKKYKIKRQKMKDKKMIFKTQINNYIKKKWMLKILKLKCIIKKIFYLKVIKKS